MPRIPEGSVSFARRERNRECERRARRLELVPASDRLCKRCARQPVCTSVCRDLINTRNMRQNRMSLPAMVRIPAGVPLDQAMSHPLWETWVAQAKERPNEH